jgi:AcrR family transcriptional regulator
MNAMSIPYEQTGRTRQKSRTRHALVAAARDLIAAGTVPTVEEAAAAAEVSRTTAYRYFPSQRSLLVAAHPETEAPSLLPADPPDEAGARFEAVIDAFTQLVADTEPQLRATLRLSLDPRDRRDTTLLRKGRAIGWIEEALAPLRGQLADEDIRRLVLAVRAATGIEARVWLTDVAGLSSREATELQRWSAYALYRTAVEETASG